MAQKDAIIVIYTHKDLNVKENEELHKSKFNGYKNIFNDSLYTYLIKNKLNKDHNFVMKKLDKFINSKKLILSIID